MARGKVYLVGAGPGDPELMTLKARRLISEADVILFDRLLDPRMLAGIKAELIDVGKTAGRHKLTQEGINQLLISKAEEGNIVVRLKGGDPYLFGRGGEEALALLEKGLAVEVVPGVTSAIAAPELAGIPVTHRGITSSLTIVTGHEEPGKDSPLDWNSIAHLGGTLVVLMGVSRLEQNVKALIDGGRDPKTPAAIVEKGGWPEQRLVTGMLEDITQKARSLNIQSPSILVVGDVVNLSKQLAKKKIAILRPAAQQEESAKIAESYGFSPIQAPAIAIVKRALPEDFPERVGQAECVAFTSANGVEIALRIDGIQAAMSEKKIVAIGPKTKQALTRHALNSEVPEEYSSSGLEKLLRGKCSRVLFLRSAQGSQYLSKELKEAGIFVDDIPLYDVMQSRDPRLDDLIRMAPSVDIFAFTSSSTARYLINRAAELGMEMALRDALQSGIVAAIGKPTADKLKDLRIRIDVMPEKYTFEAMLEALKDKMRSE